nr:recombinase family protein [Paenalcaligenes sp.]
MQADTLGGWRLDRLARSLPDFFRIMSDLERCGVGFESSTENIETSGAVGSQVVSVFMALAKFKRSFI